MKRVYILQAFALVLCIMTNRKYKALQQQHVYPCHVFSDWKVTYNHHRPRLTDEVWSDIANFIWKLAALQNVLCYIATHSPVIIQGEMNQKSYFCEYVSVLRMCYFSC